MKTYYFPNTEYIDIVFGPSEPICIDKLEVDRLCHEWGDIYEWFHEATDDEIEEYGVYDS